MKAIYSDALEVLRALEEAGYEAYLAGGCVRDRILGLEPGDYDVTTDATPEDVQNVFSKSIGVGASFGVTKVICGDNREIDVATFRADGKYSDNRRPDSVEYVSSAEEDVKRRDFTINAMLMKRTGEIIDLVGGRRDLENRIIRTVGSPMERFSEDALRMMRAIRFSIRFNAAIDPNTWDSIRLHSHLISTISKERITDELIKTFSHGRCDHSFWLLHSSGLWAKWFGDNVWNHRAWDAMKELAEVPPNAPFVVVLEAISLISSMRDREAILNKLSLTREQRRSLSSLVDRVEPMSKFLTATLASQRTMMQWDNIPLIDQVLKQHVASGRGTYHYEGQNREHYLQRRQEVAAMGYPKPLVNGDDLQKMGFIAGSIFREVLEEIFDEQLEGRLTKVEEIPAFVLSRWPAIPRIQDGRVIDLMSPARVIAQCKKCKNMMSFVVGFDEHGKMKINNISDQVGCEHSSYGTYAYCKSCSTRRRKDGFTRVNVG